MNGSKVAKIVRMAVNALYKQIGVKGMNKDIELLKERMIALIDERDKPYVIPLLNDLENAIHEHSFESGYETGYDVGYIDGHSNGCEWWLNINYTHLADKRISSH